MKYKVVLLKEIMTEIIVEASNHKEAKDLVAVMDEQDFVGKIRESDWNIDTIREEN